MIYKDHFWIGIFLIYDVTKTTWGVSWVHMTTCIIVPFFISKCYGLWDKRKKYLNLYGGMGHLSI